MWGKFRNLWDHSLSSRQVGLKASTHSCFYQSDFLPHFQGADKPCCKSLTPWTDHGQSSPMAISSVMESITWYSEPRHISLLLHCFGHLATFVIAIRGFLIIVKICLKCWETRSYHIIVSFVLELLPCCDQQYDDAIVAQDLFLEYMVFCLTGSYRSPRGHQSFVMIWLSGTGTWDKP